MMNPEMAAMQQAAPQQQMQGQPQSGQQMAGDPAVINLFKSRLGSLNFSQLSLFEQLMAGADPRFVQMIINIFPELKDAFMAVAQSYQQGQQGQPQQQAQIPGTGSGNGDPQQGLRGVYAEG